MTTTKTTLQAGMRVRRRPGIDDTNNPPFTQLPLNTNIRIFEGETVNKDSYIWQALRLANDDLGWMVSTYKGAPTFGDVAPPLPKPTKNLIGLHLLQNAPLTVILDMARRLKSTGSPLAGVTVVNNVEAANALVDLCSGPVVFRADPNGNDKPDWSTFGDSTKSFYDAGVMWLNSRYRAYMELDPRVYWQVTNEPGYHPLDGHFWRGVMDHVYGWGRRAAIFADAVGNPKDNDFLQKWKNRTAALIQAKRDKHVVVYHAYSIKGNPAGRVSPMPDLLYNELRVKTVWDTLPPEAQALIVIGEAASEHDYGLFQGIENCVAFASTLADLYSALPYVVSVNLWTTGQWNIADVSIDTALPALEAAIMRRAKTISSDQENAE